jgi:pimeloyl-ACP methyl ester carboxylesterase
MPIAAGIYYYAHLGGSTEADSIVLLHGAGGHHLHWPPDIRRLPGYDVYAPDLPGHGKSEGAGEQSISRYARHILTWMKAVDLHRSIFIGHSMGAAICLHLGIHHPTMVRGLGLIGGGVRLPVNPVLLEGVQNSTTLPIALNRILKWSFSPDADPRLVELAKNRLEETRPSVLYGDFLACNGFDAINKVENVEAPTLVICGEDDKMTPLRFSQYLAGVLPNGELTVIPQAGHMVMLEKPDQVVDALNQYLKKRLGPR